MANEYGGIDMAIHQSASNGAGNKSAERPGAGKSIVDHHEVDHLNHPDIHYRAKKAMKEHGHANVTYHDGGKL